MTTATSKTLHTGKSHTTSGPGASTKSSDGLIDLKLPQPHPAAESLFASAWSACYLAAIAHVASQKKIKIDGHPSVDTQIDLHGGGGGFFLSANMRVTIPGVARNIAQDLIDTAHTVCPYSKAVHGNIEVTTTVV